jgi:hypothetical protein
VVTTLLCSGEGDGLADAVEERSTGIDAQLAVLAIDAQGNRNCALDSWLIREFRGRGL